MAANRQLNVVGQMRLDVPHVRLIEGAVAGDFDVLAGKMLAGSRPIIVKGFTIISAGVSLASRLSLRVAGGLIIHPTASDSGSIYAAPDSDSDEILNATNPHVSGAFAPGQVNYVGLDLIRQTDTATTDLVMFLSTKTLTDSPRRIPLGRTLQRRIVITTLDPSSTPGIAPIAKITTDVSNNVTSIEDARNMLFRLGSGGGVPDPQHAFPWIAGRGDATDFTLVGDKSITSLKDWHDAIMTRIWEIGGGERWYSATADRNVTLTGIGASFSGGEYFEWDGTNVHWQGLAVLFPNSGGRINEIADQTTDLAGLTDLADGECVYVDVDYSQDLTGGSALQAVKAALMTLGSPTIPGARLVIAWRRDTQIYYRGKVGPIAASSIPVATTLILGTVKLSGTPGSSSNPRAAVLDASDRAIAAGLTRAGAVAGSGTLAIGPNSADTAITYGYIALPGGHIFDGSAGGAEVLLQRNNTDVDVTKTTQVARWRQNQGGSLKDVMRLMGLGAIAMPLRLRTPTGGDSNIPATDEAFISIRTNGLSSPERRLQAVMTWPDGTETIFATSEAS